MNLEEAIRAVQQRLGVEVDGHAGPETWSAIYQAVVADKQAPGDDAAETAVTGAKADARSEASIATLLPEVQPYARALIEKAAARKIVIKIISGARSYEEQAALYRQYRAGGPLAAPAGKSNHNFGLAFDVGIFEGSSDPEKARTYVPESPLYRVVGALGEDLGLTWGGSWKTKKDEPHFELRPAWAANLSESAMIDQLAARKAKGEDAFA